MPKQSSLICERCGKSTLHTQASINHILHLILSIITGGVWLIVWVLLALTSDGAWRCSECGKAAPGAGWGLAGSLFRSHKQNKLAEQIRNSEKQCPYCAETIKAEAIVCRYCGKDIADTARNPEPLSGVKICPHCAAKNRTEDYTCVMCDKPLP